MTASPADAEDLARDEHLETTELQPSIGMPTSVGTEPASHAALTRVTVFFIRLCLRVVWGLVLGMVFAFVYILCGTSSAVRLVTPVEDMKAHWVVVVGKKPGIYSNSLIASSQTVGVKGAIMKRCSSRAQAERHYQEAINLIRAVPDPATAPPFDNDGDTTGCEDDGDLYANSPEVLGAVALPAVALDPALAPTDLIEHAVGSGSEDNPRSSGNFRPSYTPSETIDFASTTAVSTSASQSMVIDVSDSDFNSEFDFNSESDSNTESNFNTDSDFNTEAYFIAEYHRDPRSDIEIHDRDHEEEDGLSEGEIGYVESIGVGLNAYTRYPGYIPT